jgi:tight adherence protein C
MSLFFTLLAGAVVGSGVAVLVFPAMANERAARLHASDLAIVGWTPTDLVVRQLLSIIAGAVGSAMVASAVSDGMTVMLALGIGGAVGFVLPTSMLRTTARARRRSFVHAFSAYLDLVNVLLAGGAGIETALTAAADAGDGWAFGTLRSCLVRARLSRRTPWHELRVLGARWGINEVVEVAGSMNLSGEHGARIRASLGARADSMRSRQIAEIEALAQSSTERMGVPVMMLFVGFMVLLGYPALQTVVMNM